VRSEKDKIDYPIVNTHTSEWVKNNHFFRRLGTRPVRSNAAESKPTGTGRFWLASTDGLTVEDTGQLLKMTQAPSVNETLVEDFSARLITPQSSRYVHNGMNLTAGWHGETSMAPNYYGGYFPLELGVHADRGGTYYYQNQPSAYPGFKSTIGVLTTNLTATTTGQLVTQAAQLVSHGAGDCVVQDVDASFYGGNREGGDEGAHCCARL